MKPFVYFIYNPQAGKGSIQQKISDIIALLNHHDYEVITYATRKQQDAYQKVLEIGETYPYILCCGGDGTLNEVISAYQTLKKKPKLAYLPGGTTNDFATSLKLNKDPIKALKAILKNGEDFVYDIGTLNELYFNYVAAFGSISEVSYSTPQANKNILGHTAYLLEGLKQLTKLKKYNMRIEYDDGAIEDEFCLGMIANSLTIGGYRFFKEHQIDLSDGYFECIFIKNPNNPLDIHQTISALTTKRYKNNSRIYAVRTKKLKVICTKQVKWTIDGEYAGRFTSCDIINIQHGMKIIK